MIDKKSDWKKMYYTSGFPDDSVRKESVEHIPTRKYAFLYYWSLM